MTETPKKKILFILPALTTGGAERVLITLMNNLDRSQFTPEFLAINGEGPLKDIIDPTIPYHCLDCPRVSRSLPALYKTLKAIEPDIVVSTMAHLNFHVLLMKPFFPKTRFIVREAITPDFILQEHPVIAPFIKLAYRILYSHAALVISPAQAIIDGFKKDLGMACKNHTVLPNPVDLKRIRAYENQKINILENRKKTVHFIAAGRLHSQKGFDRLIKALPDMKIPYDWYLTILGEGSEREKLEKLIKEKKLQGKVLLPGLSSTPWPHYAKADCFLMPSRWEGLPNVILESLACGTPAIVTSQSGGIAEIAESVPGNALTVVDNMEEFIQAMEKVTPNPAEKFRSSLLPAKYSIENVVSAFSSMLKKA